MITACEFPNLRIAIFMGPPGYNFVIPGPVSSVNDMDTCRRPTSVTFKWKNRGFGWTAANDPDGRAGGRRTAGLARVARAAAVRLSRARPAVLGIREAAGAHLRRCVAAVFLAMSV